MFEFIISVVISAVVAFTPSTGAVDHPSDLQAEMSALAADSSKVLFRAGAVDPKIDRLDEGFHGFSTWREKERGNLLYVVQFNRVPTSGDRTLLSDLGCEFVSYIPNNAYIVRVRPEKYATINRLSGVRAIFRLPKWAKVDPAISADGDGSITVEILTAGSLDAEPVSGFIKKMFPSAELLSKPYHHSGGRVICRLRSDESDDFMISVSGLEDVLSIIEWEPKQLFNDNSIWVGQSYDTVNTTNYSLSATVWNQGILGTGQIVCVNDSGLDADMCYFRYDGNASSVASSQALTPPDTGVIDMSRKVVAYYLEPGADAYDHNAAWYHGTHVSGSVLGDNYANLSSPSVHGHDSGDGMAPNAKLIMQDVGDSGGGLSGLAGDLTNMFQQAYDAGARIHSDSWGNTSSAYGSTALDVDEFMWRHEDFLFLIAMGNSGTAPGDGSIGDPATAKNCVSVGATTNGGAASQANDLMDYSRGPVDDGRRKPDVCSPGSNINSASGTDSVSDGNCSPKTGSGTSMATPTTSGLTTLLRQYFTDGFYPTGSKTAGDERNPSAALMKACLVNGATPMTGTDLVNSSPITPIPSMDQGWGRTNLDNVLYFSSDSRQLKVWDVWNINGLTTGLEDSYFLDVSGNTEPLKIHLVWTDPESSTLAAVNLVNNLDLEVESPTGTIYRGNVFSGGYSVTGGTADNLNPVEGVYLATPELGVWTIRVIGTAIPGTGSAPYSDRQGYALVATFEQCSGSISAPTGLVATDNGLTGIDLSWNSVAGATEYIIYKAEGATPLQSDFRILTATSLTTYEDTNVQGGYTYSYQVRASDYCNESSASNTASDAFTGNCTLYPDFGGIASALNDGTTALCDILLEWDPAVSNCPLGNTVTYNIYRDTSPYFVPGAGNIIETGFSGTVYTDYFVAPFTTYYYVVRAEDSTTLNAGPANGGNEDTNIIMIKATPWSDSTVPGTWSDDGGDTNAKLYLNDDWRVTNEQNHTVGGSLCYHSARDGNTYLSDKCIAAETPPIPMQAGQSSELSYWANYNIEVEWDGVVVEVSDNNGISWNISYPAGGYPGNFSQTGSPPINGCGYPSTETCINGPAGNGSLSGWTQFTHDLSAYAGETVLIRWNLSSDPAAEFEGFYLDDITVTFAGVNTDCATSNGAVSLDRASYNCADTVNINVGDSDLQGTNFLNVTIESGTETVPETVQLTETPAGSGSFTGSILTTSAAPSPDGLLSVADGDTISVNYTDADDGLGGINVLKTDTASVDCVMPVISNVQVINIDHDSADIIWNTNEPADSYAEYDTVTPPSAWNGSDGAFVFSHVIHITGLTECTKYKFWVQSTDATRNTASDTNGGAYFGFMTTSLAQPTYSYAGPPVAIPDSNPAGVSAAINVPDDKLVQDINVLINITHTYDGDLDIYLIAPDLTQIELSTDNGGVSANYTDTLFDDEAALSITAGTAPFTGSFRPEGLLSDFDGVSSLGNWQLFVADDAGGDTGTIDDWSITFTFPPEPCPDSEGWVEFSDVVYGCSDLLEITMVDIDLAGTGTHQVEVYSSTETVPESVILTEIPAGSAVFIGTFPTTDAPAAGGDGFLSTADGDNVTVRYIDADDGLGGINLERTDSASIDCLPPVISNVQISNITGSSADVTWDTDVIANSSVTYEDNSPPSALNESDSSFVTGHAISLTGLSECATYYLYVGSSDVYGNTVADDNSGAYYSFTTLSQSSSSGTNTTSMAIPDGNPAGVYSGITISDTDVITDVNVTVNITHTYDGDLGIYLIAPDLTQVELSTGNGGGSDNYFNTVFDDEAGTSITTGTAPFTGSYEPEGSLAALDGMNASGLWQLWVVDNSSIDAGTIDSWTIDFEYPLVACGPSAEYNSNAVVLDTCSAGGVGDGDGILDAGETIQFSVNLRNNGTDPITGVWAEITPVTAGISIVDGIALFADVNPGNNADSTVPHFSVQLGTSVICGDVLDFNIDIHSNEGSWTDSFSQIAGQQIPGGFTLIDEDFESAWGPLGDNPPVGWSIEDYGDESVPIWNNNDWYNYPKGGAYGQVARVYYSPTESQDEWLISPVFDIPVTATGCSLEFDHYYNDYDTLDFGYVQYRSDQNPSWTVLATYTVDTANMAHENIPLNAYIGDTNAQISFRYVGYYGWNWEIDNVFISGIQPSVCQMNVCAVLNVGEVPSSGGTAVNTFKNTDNIDFGHGAASNATYYNLYRGTIASLQSGVYDHDFRANTGDVCSGDNSGDMSLSDAGAVVDGSNWYYLIAGNNGSCEGSLGTNSDSAQRRQSTDNCGLASCP